MSSKIYKKINQLFLLSNPTVWVPFLVAIIGFLVGGFLFHVHHVAVDGSLIIAGLVDYPKDNLQYLIARESFTAIHLIGALFLKLGFSVWQVSFIFSGLQGMLAFLGSYFIGISLSNSIPFGLLTIILAYGVKANPFAPIGPTNYPITYMGMAETYGNVGMNYALFAVGLFMYRQNIWSRVVLLSTIFFHMSWGAYAILAGFIVLFLQKKIFLERQFKWIYIAFVVLFTLARRFHLGDAYFIPTADLNLIDSLYLGFLKWEVHRGSTNYLYFYMFRFYDIGLCLIFTGLALRHQRKSLPSCLYPLTVLFSLTFLILLMFDILRPFILEVGGHPSTLLKSFMGAMPNRYVNFFVAIAVPYMFILAVYLRSWVSLIPIGFLLPILRGVGWRGHLLCISTALMAYYFLRILPKYKRNFLTYAVGYSSFGVIGVLGIKMFFIFLWVSANVLINDVRTRNMREVGEMKRAIDWDVAVGPDRGLILIPFGMPHFMAVTGRPVVLSPQSIDALPYLWKYGPLIETYLNDLYGQTIFMTPMESTSNQAVWESRTQQVWIKLGIQYHFNEIFVPGDWKIKLPLARRNDGYAVYSTKNL
jgi:hypothetical protein